MLRRARAGLGECDGLSLALCVMLTTGRRTCEVLNGRCGYREVGPHALAFSGQAKRRVTGKVDEYVIPTLASASEVVEAMGRLRRWQDEVVLANDACARRYQSRLGRLLRSDDALAQCGTVHGLRGVYTCLAQRLFEWGDASDACVAMRVLGHSGLTESLTYTAYRVRLSSDEPSLHMGASTEVRTAFSDFSSFTESSDEAASALPFS